MSNINRFSDLEQLEIIAKRIKESGIDMTADNQQWADITYACAGMGEGARQPYHDICSNFPGYSYEECDAKFDYCLKHSRCELTLGSIKYWAKSCGIDTSMPRGRRPKSEKQKSEEQQNRFVLMAEMLRRQGEWRFNIWRQRPEIKEPGQEWRSIMDRDLDTFYCRLLESGLKVSKQDVTAMIFNRDFCPDYDALNAWLDSLAPWKPDTDPDYLHDFYVGHLEFNDPDSEALYDRLLKKWHVALVALIRGLCNENPQMPILMGKQHIGKSFFARNILPPHLSDYLHEPSPSDRIDKDFIISLSETPLILLDEISFGNTQKADAYKFIITSSKSNLRDAYAHFRESRQRRASLIATTNEENFIPNVEGTRRYLVVDLKGTVDLVNFPLPYEGAYAQALYLLSHGFEIKPSQEESHMISSRNSRYTEPNDCEEVLKTLLRRPTDKDNSVALSAGDILNEFGYKGHRGKPFSAVEIGKAMHRLKFDKKTINGKTKYHVVLIDYDARKRENEADSWQFVPGQTDVF